MSEYFQGTGDYISNQQAAKKLGVVPFSFRYDFSLILYNPIHRETNLKLYYPKDFSIILTKESFICDKLYCDNEESEWKVTEGEDEYDGEIRKFILIEKAFLTYKKS